MYKREETILLYESSLVLLTQFRVTMLRNCHDHVPAGRFCPCWSGRWVDSLQWEKNCSPQKGLNTRRREGYLEQISKLAHLPGVLVPCPRHWTQSSGPRLLATLDSPSHVESVPGSLCSHQPCASWTKIRSVALSAAGEAGAQIFSNTTWKVLENRLPITPRQFCSLLHVLSAALFFPS